VSRTRKSDHPYAIKALRRLIPNLLTFLAVLATVPVGAQEPAKPASRAEATAIIANARKIVTPVPRHYSKRTENGEYITEGNAQRHARRCVFLEGSLD
jgi:hypothetical protein